MDMAMRSFVLAAALALFAAAGLIGWNVFGGGMPGFGWLDRSGDEAGRSGAITITPGSLYDEFGEGEPQVRRPFDGDRTAGDFGGDFGGDRSDDRIRLSSRSRPTGAAADAFNSGPRFDWSGSPSGSDAYALPRTTPAERVEADCRIRGGSNYGCRCLVRLARQDLSEAQLAFLSLAEEQEPRPERLQAAGLAPRDLSALAGRLVMLDVEARRRCGAGLAF